MWFLALWGTNGKWRASPITEHVWRLGPNSSEAGQVGQVGLNGAGASLSNSELPVILRRAFRFLSRPSRRAGVQFSLSSWSLRTAFGRARLARRQRILSHIIHPSRWARCPGPCRRPSRLQAAHPVGRRARAPGSPLQNMAGGVAFTSGCPRGFH